MTCVLCHNSVTLSNQHQAIRESDGLLDQATAALFQLVVRDKPSGICDAQQLPRPCRHSHMPFALQCCGISKGGIRIRTTEFCVQSNDDSSMYAGQSPEIIEWEQKYGRQWRAYYGTVSLRCGPCNLAQLMPSTLLP